MTTETPYVHDPWDEFTVHPEVTRKGEYQDAPELGRSADQWPYPNHYVDALAEGELAARICARFGVEGDEPVYLRETTVSDGYSEWTQENFTYLEVICGAPWSQHCVKFDERQCKGNSFVQLLAWLDEEVDQ